MKFYKQLALILVLVLVLASIVSYWYVRMSIYDFYAEKDKIIDLIHAQAKKGGDREFQESFAKTVADFIDGLPILIVYHPNEGILNSLFDNITDMKTPTLLNRDELYNRFAEAHPGSPNAPWAEYQRGRLMQISGKNTEALVHFDRAVQIETSRNSLFDFFYKDRLILVNINYMRGMCHFPLKQYDLARKFFEEALNSVPKDFEISLLAARIHGRIAETYLLENNSEKADETMSILESYLKDKEKFAIAIERYRGDDKANYKKTYSGFIRGISDRLNTLKSIPLEKRQAIFVYGHELPLNSILKSISGNAAKKETAIIDSTPSVKNGMTGEAN